MFEKKYQEIRITHAAQNIAIELDKTLPKDVERS